MGRTKKAGSKQGKTKKHKMEKEDLEDLYSDSGSDSGSETGSETDEDFSLSDFSLSKELDKAFISSYDDIKDGDMTMPVFGIGISLIALLGFVIYKGSAV
jgi:hypothetical protein